MNFTELLGHVGVVGLAVMGCLLALSVYSVGVIFDKYRRFRAASRQSQVFLPACGNFLRAGKLQDAIDAARLHRDSHVAQVITAGILEFGGTRQTATDPATRFEMVSSALERSKIRTLTEMKRGLALLATIGSTAPFIGLFGTVVGIINAFRGIAATGSGGVAAVSGGIAEALIATALGIFVAIPAVIAFNLFTATLERFQVEMNGASSELVEFLFKATRVAHADR
jgi:biopolymer transport protein ExbB/biopolymer transport protein TolQ